MNEQKANFEKMMLCAKFALDISKITFSAMVISGVLYYMNGEWEQTSAAILFVLGTLSSSILVIIARYFIKKA